MKTLPLDKLRLDGETQLRATMDQAIVDEYAEAYKRRLASSPKTPRWLPDIKPPVVFHEPHGPYWLADGFYRVRAAKQAGLDKLPCEVIAGSQEDAQWYAVAANQAHGLRRSTADKAKAIKAALKHPKAKGMSDRQLAEYVGVSASFVGNRRKESEDAGESPPKPRPSRGGEGVNGLHQQPDSGDTEVEYEKCPKCGGEEFFEDGTCESCISDADQGEETGVKPTDPGDPATILKCDIRDVVQSWMKNVNGANPMVAAAVLENCAAELRDGQ